MFYEVNLQLSENATPKKLVFAVLPPYLVLG